MAYTGHINNTNITFSLRDSVVFTRSRARSLQYESQWKQIKEIWVALCRTPQGLWQILVHDPAKYSGIGGVSCVGSDRDLVQLLPDFLGTADSYGLRTENDARYFDTLLSAEKRRLVREAQTILQGGGAGLGETSRKGGQIHA